MSEDDSGGYREKVVSSDFAIIGSIPVALLLLLTGHGEYAPLPILGAMMLAMLAIGPRRF